MNIEAIDDILPEINLTEDSSEVNSLKSYICDLEAEVSLLTKKIKKKPKVVTDQKRELAYKRLRESYRLLVEELLPPPF